MNTKYTEALGRLHHLVVLNTGPDRDKDAIVSGFEDLIRYMDDNFRMPATVPDIAQVQDFLDGRLTGDEILYHLQQMPPTVPETVWPIYVMRLLMRDVRLPDEVMRGKAFVRWAIKYANVIC